MTIRAHCKFEGLTFGAAAKRGPNLDLFVLSLDEAHAYPHVFASLACCIYEHQSSKEYICLNDLRFFSNREERDMQYVESVCCLDHT